MAFNSYMLAEVEEVFFFLWVAGKIENLTSCMFGSQDCALKNYVGTTCHWILMHTRLCESHV